MVINQMNQRELVVGAPSPDKIGRAGVPALRCIAFSRIVNLTS